MSSKFLKEKKIREDFLHFVWKHRRISFENLLTTSNLRITVVSPGIHNSNAGPDFLDARIKVGDTLWAGNVEIHVASSDWQKHGHDSDPAYENVILHVVYIDDKPVLRKNDTAIPCLELKNLIAKNSLSKYFKLKYNNNNNWIPCRSMFGAVPGYIVESALSRLMVERLERKTESVFQALTRTKNDFEQVLFENIAKYIGANVNSQPFELLAIHTPWKLLSKYKGQINLIEALLFGQSGLLEKHTSDKYPCTLKKDYLFLKHKHGLSHIPAQWRFLRLRPPNFPTLRIAQLATLVNQRYHFLSELIQAPDIYAARKVFAVSPSQYWKSHYTFDKPGPEQDRSIGSSSIDIILINGVIPFLFCYAGIKGDEKLRNKVIDWLEDLPPENNALIKNWKLLGIQATNAGITQALMELKNQYCDKKKCLHCNIGAHIIK